MMVQGRVLYGFKKTVDLNLSEIFNSTWDGLVSFSARFSAILELSNLKNEDARARGLGFRVCPFSFAE